MSASRTVFQGDDGGEGPSDRSARRRSTQSSRSQTRGEGSSSTSNSRPQRSRSSQDQMQWVEDGDDDDAMYANERFAGQQQRLQRPSLATIRRTSSQSSSGRADGARRSSSIPHAPPTLESEGLYDDLADGGYNSESGSGGEDTVHGGDNGVPVVKPENVLGGWHFAPLLIAIVPPLGAVLGGHSDAWSDAILLALASFWLYQFLKVPHDIYHAARTRRVLHVDAMTEEEAALAESASDPTNPSAFETEAIRKRRQEQSAAAAELRRAELISLVALIGSPLAGAWLLTWMMDTFTDGNRYLNNFNIRLFMLASGIRPWSHALNLFRRRLLHLQEVVHYPSSRVEALTRRLGRLESDLSTLRKLVATKSDVSVLREGIDLPLTQLSRSMRRYERKEETLRMSAEDKFSLVEARLEDLLREVAINAELIEEERRERQRATTLPASIFQALKYALGQRSRDYYEKDYGAHRSIGHRTSLGVQAAPDQMHGHAQMLSTSSTLSQGSNSSASSGDSLPDYSSPQPALLPPYMQQSLQRSVMRTSGPRSGGWTEEGLAYWVFWPINLPRSLLRMALSYATNEKANNEKLHAAYARQGPALIAGSPLRELRTSNLAPRGGVSYTHRGVGSPASPTGAQGLPPQVSSLSGAMAMQPPPQHQQQQQSGKSSHRSSSAGKAPSRMRTGGNGSSASTGGGASSGSGGSGSSTAHGHQPGEPLTAGAAYGRRA